MKFIFLSEKDTLMVLAITFSKSFLNNHPFAKRMQLHKTLPFILLV